MKPEKNRKALHTLGVVIIVFSVIFLLIGVLFLAAAIYGYCMNGRLSDSAERTWVLKAQGKNLYVKNGSVVRTDDNHPDAAPEFKCVLIDDAGEQFNCEFQARGLIVMFVEGQRFSDSNESPNVEKIYNSIVEKFLRG